MAGTGARGRSGGLAGWVVAGGVGGAAALVAFAAVALLVNRRDLKALVGRLRGRRAARGGAGRPDDEPGPDDAAPYPPRVLLVLATSAGGVGRHVRALGVGLAGQGCRVTVAGHPATEASFGFAASGAVFEPVDVGDRPRPGADLRAVRRLRALLTGADVVHAHGLRAAALVVLAARLTRAGRATRAGGRRRPGLVVTLHNAPVTGGAAGLVSAALERVVARGADAVLVVSGDLGERMRALGARWVDRALVPAPHRKPSGPASQVRARLRAELGIGEGTVLLLTVARLAPQKGLPVLFAAIRQLAAGRPEDAVAAVVAGDGPLAAELAAEVAADPALPLRLLGARDDVADLLLAADALVMSSRWEGQPLAVQEALRAGLPVVATRAGGTAEVTGDAALLVAPQDAAALAEALARVVDDADLRQDLARRGAARAVTLPGDADAVEQVLRVYRSTGNASAVPSGVVPRATGPTG